MSTSLFWKPAPINEPEPETLDYDLKKAIAPRVWDHDGSIYGPEILFDKTRIPYLQGLADAHVDGAQELIDLIVDHGAVILWIGS